MSDWRGRLRALRHPAPLVVGWTFIAAGAVALFIGWFGLSGESLVAKQLPYLVSGGLGGLALVVVGAALITTYELRTLFERLASLEPRVDSALDEARPEAPAVDARDQSQSTSRNGQVLALANGARFHTASCPVVLDKPDVLELSVDEARAGGLAACRVCRPV